MNASKWFDLSGKVVLVTGAGSNGGIGHGIALGLASAGADVFVADVDADGAETTAREIRVLGRRSVACRCDNGVPADVEAMFAALDRELGPIDVLVNNVGIGHRARPEEISLADWQKVLRVNLDGTFLCSMEAGKRMIERGQGGCIINVSSIAGASALGRGNFVYSVSKAGIIQLTKELAVEWAGYGIRVNSIMPSQTLTPAVEQWFADPRFDVQVLKDKLLSGIPLGRFGLPEDMAKAAVFLASDAAGYITGHALPVDGGNLALNAAGNRFIPV